MNIAAQIIEIANKNGNLITTAESCTGGMVAAAITDIPGSSSAFERGFVTYSNRAKIDMLGVTQASLDAYGAVSEQVAAEMALGAVVRADAQLAASITGIAGPGGSEHKPEGRVCFAIADETGIRVNETVDFGALGRDGVRIAARDHALRRLLEALQEH